MLERIGFAVRGTPLTGTLHVPDGTVLGVALVLHGYGGDPEQPHVVDTCAALARAGVAAARFAYRDHQPPKMTYASALEDARGAARELEHRGLDTRRLAVVGFSFSGAVAALLAAAESSTRAVVIAAGIAHTRDGLDPVAALAEAKAPTLLLWGTRDDHVPLLHARRYEGALEAASVRHELRMIEGADHDFGPGRCRAEMAAAVAGWVRASL